MHSLAKFVQKYEIKHWCGKFKKIRSCTLFDKFQSYITVILKFFVAYFHTLTWHQNILSYIAILLSHIVILSSCHILCLSPHPALRQGKWQCCGWGRDHLGPCNIVLISLWLKCCHFKYLYIEYQIKSIIMNHLRSWALIPSFSLKILILFTHDTCIILINRKSFQDRLIKKRRHSHIILQVCLQSAEMVVLRAALTWDWSKKKK